MKPDELDDDLKAYYQEVREANSEWYRIVDLLRDRFLTAIPETEETIRWGHPTFLVEGTPLFYLEFHENYIEFGIFNVDILPRIPDHGFSGPGSIRYFKLSAFEDAQSSRISTMIDTAVEAHINQVHHDTE